MECGYGLVGKCARERLNFNRARAEFSLRFSAILNPPPAPAVDLGIVLFLSLANVSLNYSIERNDYTTSGSK